MRNWIVRILFLGISMAASHSGWAQRVPEHSWYAGVITQQVSRTHRMIEFLDSEPYEQWGAGAELYYERRYVDWLSLRLGVRYATHGSQINETDGGGFDVFTEEKVGQLHLTASPLYVHNWDRVSLYAGPGLGFGAVRHHTKQAGVRRTFDQNDLESQLYVAANFRFTTGVHFALDRSGRHRIEVQAYWDYQSNQVLELFSTEIYPEFEMSSLGVGVGYRLDLF